MSSTGDAFLQRQVQLSARQSDPAGVVVGTATGVAVSVTKPAIGGNSWAFDYAVHSYSATPAAGRLTLVDTNNVTHFDIDVLNSGIIVTPLFKALPEGVGFTLTLSGQAGATGKLNVVPWKQ